MVVVATPDELCLVDQNDDILITGVGALNVIKTLQNVPRGTPLINVGYAGGNGLKVGERVSIGKVKLYHPNVDYKEDEFDIGGDAVCYTSADFVEKTEITEKCVFDMELAFILALGFTNVQAFKVVSDNLDYSQYEERVRENNV